MNVKGIICILSISFLSVLSCKTTKYTPTSFEGNMISFGNFGGFTGEMDAYHLLSNGQLFKQKGRTTEFTALNTMKKKEVKAIFEQYEVLEINQIQIDQPGNLSYFLEMKDADKSHKIIWSDESLQISAELKAFYTMLYELTKSES